MSDDLRTRIAKVLQAQPPVGLQSQFDWLDWTENRADAVIRELGPLVRYWDKDFKELHYCRECGGWGPKDD